MTAPRSSPGEDEALQVEARRLSQAGALVEHAQRMVDALEGDEGNALGALGLANRALTALEKVDPATADWRELLDAAYANLSELSRLATDYAASVRKIPTGWPSRTAAGPSVPADREIRSLARGGPGHPGARQPPSWICWTPRTPTCAPWLPGARPPSGAGGACGTSARGDRRPQTVWREE